MVFSGGKKGDWIREPKGNGRPLSRLAMQLLPGGVSTS